MCRVRGSYNVLSVFSRSSVRQLKPLMKWVCITEINVWLLSYVNCNFNENSRASRWLFTRMIYYAYISFPLKLRKSFQSKDKFKFSIFSIQIQNFNAIVSKRKKLEENNLKSRNNSSRFWFRVGLSLGKRLLLITRCAVRWHSHFMDETRSSPID